MVLAVAKILYSENKKGEFTYDRPLKVTKKVDAIISQLGFDEGSASSGPTAAPDVDQIYIQKAGFHKACVIGTGNMGPSLRAHVKSAYYTTQGATSQPNVEVLEERLTQMEESQTLTLTEMEKIRQERDEAIRRAEVAERARFDEVKRQRERDGNLHYYLKNMTQMMGLPAPHFFPDPVVGPLLLVDLLRTTSDILDTWGFVGRMNFNFLSLYRLYFEL